MMRKYLLLSLLIPAALGLTGCGIGTFGLNATTAAIKNAQTIKFAVAIVDEKGAPLDDVKVEIVRNTQEADVYWPGEYTQGKKEPAQVVSGNFHYESSGGVCVKATFSKPGFETVTNYYANSDEFAPDGRLVSLAVKYKAMNVSKNSPPAVVMVKEPEVSSR